MTKSFVRVCVYLIVTPLLWNGWINLDEIEYSNRLKPGVTHKVILGTRRHIQAKWELVASDVIKLFLPGFSLSLPNRIETVSVCQREWKENCKLREVLFKSISVCLCTVTECLLSYEENTWFCCPLVHRYLILLSLIYYF